MDGVEVFFIGLMFAIGVTVGSLWEMDGWRADCVKLGAHRANGEIYKCEKVK
jgi:hypothetical protein